MAEEEETRRDSPVEMAKAIWGGIKDTAHDMLDEGRKGSKDANDSWWRRYDDLTKFREGRRRQD